jgi:predicted DNA-binding protein (MmcQ/YjbR family)
MAKPARSFTGGLLQRVRELCLSFPETSERSSWGHPNFRAGKKTFATLEGVQGRPSIAFRLDRDEVTRLSGRKNFFVTPYGRGLWVSVWADVPADWRLIEGLVRRSYRGVALKRMLAALDGPEGA